MIKMLEVVINNQHGGFSLSDSAVIELQQRKNNPEINKYRIRCPRHDSILVEIVKRNPEKASGRNSKLKIVEIDEEFVDIYIIDEYDGAEEVVISPRKLCEKLLKFNNIDEMKNFIKKVTNF